MNRKPSNAKSVPSIPLKDGPAARKHPLSRVIGLLSNPQRVFGGIKRTLLRQTEEIDWEHRAEKLGAYAVINIEHPPEEFDRVTRQQKEILFPVLQTQLNSSERTILDFGCGPGRFTPDLAHLIHGKATGVDVTQKLLQLAPPSADVEYLHSTDFFATNTRKFDAIWVCLVLGGIPTPALQAMAPRMADALATNGLFFLVECTADQPAEGSWRVRTVEDYLKLFPTIALQKVAEYYDANQQVSIFAGRKR